MITLKTLKLKNFLSIGNVEQTINFDNKDLTLILGENLDLGGNDAGSRNGTGKTTFIRMLAGMLPPDADEDGGDAPEGDVEGEPGLRPEYHAHYYGAYFRDPDGNNVEAVCHRPDSTD